MPTIRIRDLPESVDLDRQAMQAIAGGARLRGRQAVMAPTRTNRIIDYPGSPSLHRPDKEASGKPHGRK